MKPRKKARKGKQGSERAAPGMVDAKQARRRVAKGGRNARKELIEHRVPCPVCGQMATAHSVKPPELRRDALGRRPRLERQELHERLKRRIVLVFPGKHPLTIALQHVAVRECEAQGLCANSLAYLAHLDEATVRACFECEGRCATDTMHRIFEALEMPMESALTAARQWLKEHPPGQG